MFCFDPQFFKLDETLIIPCPIELNRYCTPLTTFLYFYPKVGGHFIQFTQNYSKVKS